MEPALDNTKAHTRFMKPSQVSELTETDSLSPVGNDSAKELRRNSVEDWANAWDEYNRSLTS